ncbi:MAG: hypothetical protein CM15mV42_0340 [uncultured marine virus]|nr:MAG: hypothetical protein CM15mV42_0340 [uncultured marine virus]
MKCAYCYQGFSCGCQKTKAPDGQTVHKKCLQSYTNNKMKPNTKSSSSLTEQIKRAKQNLSR